MFPIGEKKKNCNRLYVPSSQVLIHVPKIIFDHENWLGMAMAGENNVRRSHPRNRRRVRREFGSDRQHRATQCLKQVTRVLQCTVCGGRGWASWEICQSPPNQIWRGRLIHMAQLLESHGWRYGNNVHACSQRGAQVGGDFITYFIYTYTAQFIIHRSQNTIKLIFLQH